MLQIQFGGNGYDSFITHSGHTSVQFVIGNVSYLNYLATYLKLIMEKIKYCMGIYSILYELTQLCDNIKICKGKNSKFSFSVHFYTEWNTFKQRLGILMDLTSKNIATCKLSAIECVAKQPRQDP